MSESACASYVTVSYLPLCDGARVPANRDHGGIIAREAHVGHGVRESKSRHPLRPLGEARVVVQLDFATLSDDR